MHHSDSSPNGVISILCSRVEADLENLGPRITRSIRLSQPEYVLVPLEDHVEHVTEQQRILLRALGRNEVVGAGPKGRAADLGRLRATQGLSLSSVIGAYHVGNRELWDALDASAQSGAERAALPGLASLMWRSIEVMTAEIAAAYETTARRRESDELLLRQRFVELLERDEMSAELEDIASTLGFDPNGDFVAATVGELGDPSAEAAALTAVLGPEIGFAVSRVNGIRALAQGISETEMEARVRSLRPDIHAGVGLARSGLVGARESLVDSHLCLENIPGSDPIRRFRENWMRACIRAQVDRLEPLVREFQKVIEANPHLVETVVTYAESGFSVSETARNLHLHPNSVSYRLDRWNRLTGWDARSLIGVNHSLLAATLM